MDRKSDLHQSIDRCRLSVLPPQNASGNWVKVVQRVPVRLELDPRMTCCRCAPA